MTTKHFIFLITLLLLPCSYLLSQEAEPSLVSQDSERWSATLHLYSGEKIAYTSVVVETYYAVRVRKTDGKDFTASWGNIKYIVFDQAGRSNEATYNANMKKYMLTSEADQRWSATLCLNSGEQIAYSTVVVESPVAVRIRKSADGKDFTAPWGNIKYIMFNQSGRSQSLGEEAGKPSLLAPSAEERWSATLYLQTGEKIAYNSVIVESSNAVRVRKTDGKDFTAPWWNIKYIMFDQAGRNATPANNTDSKTSAVTPKDSQDTQRILASLLLQTRENIPYNTVVVENALAVRVRKPDNRDFTAPWGNISYIKFE